MKKFINFFRNKITNKKLLLFSSSFLLYNLSRDQFQTDKVICDTLDYKKPHHAESSSLVGLKSLQTLLKEATGIEFEIVDKPDSKRNYLSIDEKDLTSKVFIQDLISFLDTLKQNNVSLLSPQIITNIESISENSKKNLDMLSQEQKTYFSLYSPLKNKNVIVPKSIIQQPKVSSVVQFSPIESFNNQEDLNEALEKLSAKECAIVLKFNEDSREQTVDNFLKHVVDSEALNFSFVQVLLLPSQISTSSFELYVKAPNSKSKGEKSKKIQKFKLSSQQTLEKSVLDELSTAVEELTAFKPKFINLPRRPYVVSLVFDRSKDKSYEINFIREAVTEAKTKLGAEAHLYEFNDVYRTVKDSEQKPARVVGLIADQEVRRKFMLHKNTSLKELIKTMEEESALLSPVPLLYTMQEEIEADSLVKFCLDLKQGEAQPYYKSQNSLKFQKHSRKVVGEEFKEKIVDNNASQAIFYYSKHCGSCKRFMPYYEELALNAIKDCSSTVFNRIDNDENSSPVRRAYISTPRIVFYRGDCKDKPFQYVNTILTKKLLTDFYTLTEKFDLIKDEKFGSSLERLALEFQKMQHEGKRELASS